MMLTALNATDGTIIDVTLLGANVEELNGKRVAQRHGYDLICKGCYRPTHLVRNHHRTTFFRHDPGTGSCILHELTRGNSESEEHLRAKATIIGALRDLSGWTAEPEQRHDEDGETVIIDVAAHYSGPHAHDAQGDYAWEVQLSSQTAGEFAERSNTIQRITGHRVTWLTPHAKAVGRHAAMICDPGAETITDRLLESFDPWIPAPPMSVERTVKSVHQQHPKHLHVEILDELGIDRNYHVVDINAFGNPRARRDRTTRNTHVVEAPDTGCQRAGWQPIEIEMPYAGQGDHICGRCGTPIDGAPWGFTFDPPLHQQCFQERQSMYLQRGA